MTTLLHDPVEQPSHYIGNGLEVINVIEDWRFGFHLGNAIKYILRAGKKSDAVEDLQKAQWYISRAAIYGWDVYEGDLEPHDIRKAFGISLVLTQAIAGIFAAAATGHEPALRIADRRIQVEINQLQFYDVEPA